jgi:DNA-binding beta-propeller fold protein YncE
MKARAWLLRRLTAGVLGLLVPGLGASDGTRQQIIIVNSGTQSNAGSSGSALTETAEQARGVVEGSVSFVDAATWKHLASVRVGIAPRAALIGNGEGRLYVFCEGTTKAVAKDTLEQGSLSVLDIRTHDLVARWALGPRLGDVHVSDDDRTAVCVARGDRKSPAQVVVTSLEPGGALGRLSLSGECVGSVLSRDGTRLVVAVKDVGRGTTPAGAKLVVVDPVRLTVVREVTIPRLPEVWLRSLDGRFAVFQTAISAGGSGQGSQLFVWDLMGDSLAGSFALGRGAGHLRVDPRSGRFYAWAKRDTGPGWVLHILDGGGPARSVPFDSEPVDLACDGPKDSVVVLLPDSLLVIDVARAVEVRGSRVRRSPPTLQVPSGPPGPPGALPLGLDARPRRQLVVTPDGSKAFVFELGAAEIDLRVTGFDLVRGQETRVIPVTRPGWTLLRALPKPSSDFEGGGRWATRPLELLEPPRDSSHRGFRLADSLRTGGGHTTFMWLGREGRFLYVLGPQTRNLTVIETATDSVVARIPGGGDCLVDVGVPDRLLIRDSREVNLVDTKGNARAGGASVSGLEPDSYAPPEVAAVDTASQRAFLVSSSGVMALDLRTGAELGLVKKQDHPRFVLWTRP